MSCGCAKCSMGGAQEGFENDRALAEALEGLDESDEAESRRWRSMPPSRRYGAPPPPALFRSRPPARHRHHHHRGGRWGYGYPVPAWTPFPVALDIVPGAGGPDPGAAMGPPPDL